MISYAKLQSSRIRHQYGIFGGKSQTSFTRNATRAGSEEGRLFSQATENPTVLENQASVKRDPFVKRNANLLDHR